ncbi:MAG: IS66 family transposase [Pseudomonadota bacterium]|nr:IS66 family transposase [Pseudomonadota bacterium]
MNESNKIQALSPAALLGRIEALEREVGELQRQNADLRAENERLRRRQQRQAAPFSKEAPVAKRKRAGRKPGQGVFRYRQAPEATTLSEPPILAPVVESACPRCGGVLVADGEELASTTDLPQRPQPVVRQYRVALCRCTLCGARVRGRHPDLAPSQHGATAHRVGPRLLAAGQVLHYAGGVPLRRVPAVLCELTGASVTEGALVQDGQRRVRPAGTVGQRYAELRAGVRTAERVHTDDTGWRVGGKPAQLMVFETDQTTVYQIRDRHRNEEVREVVPADYSGVLCTDRGRSYDARALATVRQQKCGAHLQRSITEVLETKWGRGRSLGLQLRALFAESVALWHGSHAGTVTDYDAQVALLEARLGALLAPRTLPDPDNQRLLDELGRHHARGNLLRYLHDPRIEPTNNRAERALRPAVIARKVSQCSKNDCGAATFAAFASVTRTLARRGGSVLDSLEHLFRSQPTAHPPPAPAPPGR